MMQIEKLELNEDMNTEPEVILEISQEELNSRIELIKQILTNLAADLRKEVPIKNDQDLVDDLKFQKWLIANLILENMYKDEENIDFNRFLYVMFNKCDKSVIKLLEQYNIDVKRDSKGQVCGFELIVMEEEIE